MITVGYSVGDTTPLIEGYCFFFSHKFSHTCCLSCCRPNKSRRVRALPSRTALCVFSVAARIAYASSGYAENEVDIFFAGSMLVTGVLSNNNGSNSQKSFFSLASESNQNSSRLTVLISEEFPISSVQCFLFYH